MPIYEYQCQQCGKIVTKTVLWSQIKEPIGACPACGNQMVKIMSVPAKGIVK